MKEFLKMTGATIVGLIIFFVALGFIGIMCLVGMVASSESTKNISDNSVLVLNLSGNLNERANDNIFNRLHGIDENTIGLDDMLGAIKRLQTMTRLRVFISRQVCSLQILMLRFLLSERHCSTLRKQESG